MAMREAVKGAVTSKIDETIEIIKCLISAGANINSEAADQGKTALMLACEKGYIDLVRCILDLNSLVDHRDQKKRTALFYAIGSPAQNIDVVQELIKNQTDVNIQTVTGISPLLLAAEKGHDLIIKELLACGADYSFQGGDNSNSALHLCCIRGDPKSTQVLLEFCKKKLDDSSTQEFIFLKNKKNQIALDIAEDQKNSKKQDENRQKVFKLLNDLHLAQ